MKKSILRILSLALVAAMLFACTSCTQTILIRFVDAEGKDINIGGTPVVGPTDAPTAAPVTEAPTAAPVTEAPTAAPVTEAPATQTPATEAPATQAPATQAPATEAPATQAPATEAPATEATTAAPSNSVPTGKDAIVDFYKAAVNKVKNDGAAGYVKKEWQTISNLNITGNGMVDGKIADIVGGYMTTADQAENQNSAKGSDDAKNRFPGFTLTDYSKIVAAECTANGSGNYAIKITSAVEDTPKKEGSMIGTITSSYLAWEDITTEIDNNVTIVKDYKENTHLMYDVVIEAEITPDGKFVSMTHTTRCDIKIGSAKILIVTLKDKAAHLDNFCTYTNFAY